MGYTKRRRPKSEIALLRMSRGMTQVEIAKKIGITKEHYGRIETGVSGVSLRTLRNLSKELNVPVENLLTMIYETEMLN